MKYIKVSISNIGSNNLLIKKLQSSEYPITENLFNTVLNILRSCNLTNNILIWDVRTWDNYIWG